MSKPSEKLNNPGWLRYTADKAHAEAVNLTIEAQRLNARISNAKKLELDCYTWLKRLGLRRNDVHPDSIVQFRMPEQDK